MNNYLETKENITDYLKRKRSNKLAEFSKPSSGFMYNVKTTDGCYLTTVIFDKLIKAITIEVTPGIHCPKPYRAMCSMEISKINSYHKCGYAYMDGISGNISFKLTQFFLDSAISESTFEEMEKLLIKIADANRNTLESVSHGMLVSNEDDELEKLAESLLKDRAKFHNLPQRPNEPEKNDGLTYDELFKEVFGAPKAQGDKTAQTLPQQKSVKDNDGKDSKALQSEEIETALSLDEFAATLSENKDETDTEQMVSMDSEEIS